MILSSRFRPLLGDRSSINVLIVYIYITLSSWDHLNRRMFELFYQIREIGLLRR